MTTRYHDEFIDNIPSMSVRNMLLKAWLKFLHFTDRVGSERAMYWREYYRLLPFKRGLPGKRLHRGIGFMAGL